MVFSFLLAIAARGALRGWAKGIGPATRRALGAPDPSATWARGEWACGRCRSLNRGSATACERCRAPRAQAEIRVAAPGTAPDIIPAEIRAGPTSVVTLEHNPGAHGRGLTGHWRLRVNTVIVGSAARRDGALALLRAVRGASAVMFDADGEGFAAYGLPDLVRAFEAPRLPLRTPCAEADASPR